MITLGDAMKAKPGKLMGDKLGWHYHHVKLT
jgi:hypothetical protein